MSIENYRLAVELIDAIRAKYPNNTQRMVIEATLIECSDAQKLRERVEQMKEDAA